MKYRTDIDGLRAVAIVPVVLFHSGSSLVSGGYIGVDIFFVISGFLITSVIVSGFNQQRFSFRHFYERRARRLLPALFAVLLFCLIIGYFVMSPVQYQDMGVSFIATVFYVTNILMWSRSGYFQTSAENDPLLHMWSLSVEEQFYIFYPILLLLFFRFLKKDPLVIVIILSLLSFVLSIWGVSNKPNPTFYLLPTRIWELGAGAIVALSLIGSNWSLVTRNIAAIVGFILVICPILLYQSTTPFPGLAAFPPVLGTALIISAGIKGENIVGQFLSWKPFIGIGLISYSLYLWHWPIFAFLNIHFGLSHIPPLVSFIGVVVSVILSILSWKYVEQPFRSSERVSAKKIFTLSVIGIGLFTAIGAILWAAKGFQSRFDIQTNAAFRAAEGNPYRERCLSRHLHQGLCTLGEDNGEVSFVLWGDSHAMSAGHGFDLAASQHGVSGYLASHSDCPPILGVSGSPLHNGGSCEKFRRDIKELIETTESIQTVILHARWPRYTEEELDWEVGFAPKFELLDKELPPFKDTYSRNFIDEGLLEMVKELRRAGKTVFIVESVPEQPFEVAYTVGRSLGFGTELPEASSAAFAKKRNRVFPRLEASLIDLGAILYPVIEKVCKDQCEYIEKGSPLYEDDNHLSIFGSEYVFSDFPFSEIK